MTTSTQPTPLPLADTMKIFFVAEYVAREANAALIGANAANTNDGKIASPFLLLFQAKFFVDSSNSR